MIRDTTPPLQQRLAQGVEAQVFPGAAAAVISDHGRSVHLAAAGRLTAGGAEASTHALYDLASLTKPFVALAFVRLWSRGVLSPADPATNWIPEWQAAGAGDVRLEHLLGHEAGLPAWVPFFEDIPARELGKPSGRTRVMTTLLATPLESRPGSRTMYSDLGFMALGLAMERATGVPLDRILHDEVLDPLDLRETRFCPGRAAADPSAVSPGLSIAPTELCPWRGRVLVGEVHDENAWAMGGVAPHAGLFSTVFDMGRLVSALLKALTGDHVVFSPEFLARSVSKRPLGRTLGWDTPDPVDSSAGPTVSRDAFGHLGFTGCSMWIDPAKGAGIVLLSNRVHPTRANEAIRRFRPAFHEAAFAMASKHA